MLALNLPERIASNLQTLFTIAFTPTNNSDIPEQQPSPLPPRITNLHLEKEGVGA